MEKTYHIAITDDDKEIRELLTDFLQQHGFTVSCAKDGASLFELLKQQPEIDLVILDVMMPGMDGIEICRRLRQQHQIAILMLTAVTSETDRILGLEFGADDYLSKPFNPRELLARIKAILRRVSTFNTHNDTQEVNTHSKVYKFEGWTLDISSRRLLSSDNIEVSLSSGCYDLLLAFLERPQHVLSRDHIMDITKNRSADYFDRSIDVQISRLRQKLEVNPKEPKLIKTVRSGGYLFTAKVSRS